MFQGDLLNGTSHASVSPLQKDGPLLVTDDGSRTIWSVS
jgi:hypothetical protein